MAIPGLKWVARHRNRLLVVLAGLLLLVIAFEGFLLYEQRSAIRATEAYSSKLLTTFLEGDTTQVSGAPGVGVPIRLQNVRFKWSDKVYIDTGNMAVRAVPVQGKAVDFDDLDSFHLTLQQSVVLIRPDVLEGMFNESVFNYPHSKLRDLKVRLKRDDGDLVLRVSGNVNVGLWIPFKMNAHLQVDQTNNTLTIDVDHLKVFGVLPVTKLVKLEPFQLEHLISMPPNESLVVHGNRMMVKPFGLFPPPRVDGRMSTVTLDDKGIHLAFAGSPIPAPESSAENYVYLRGGTSQFGRFCMADTDILIIDQDQSDPFVFSLLGYEKMIPRSRLDIRDTQSVRVVMPDL